MKTGEGTKRKKDRCWLNSQLYLLQSTSLAIHINKFPLANGYAIQKVRLTETYLPPPQSGLAPI